VNRLERHFAGRRSDGRRSLVVYLCAGDPDLAATERLVPALAAAGADVIELGVPFSDPLADGPTIQGRPSARSARERRSPASWISSAGCAAAGATFLWR